MQLLYSLKTHYQVINVECMTTFAIRYTIMNCAAMFPLYITCALVRMLTFVQNIGVSRSEPVQFRSEREPKNILRFWVSSMLNGRRLYPINYGDLVHVDNLHIHSIVRVR